MASAGINHTLQTSALIRSLKAQPTEAIETHISWVFLAGEFAYKVKKPVDLGFVDFSTLERRRFFCEEELRLNRRLAPDLYLDVLPITGSPESPQIGGTGTAFEYCVRMRRFEQDSLLSRMVAAGKLLPEHIDLLTRQVSEFHARIPVADPSTRFGTPEAVAEPIRANFKHLAKFTHRDRREDREVREIVDRLRQWSEKELSNRRDVLEARRENKFIRECHGDMHLGNMILAKGAITIFDCIEFNEDLRWIDVMSELAFCTMDLEDRGRADLARRFLNASLEWSGDYAGLALFPLYFTYRAMVRAKVAQLRREQADLAAGENERLATELMNYLELASTWAGGPSRRPPPFLALTHGLSGSGKTSGSQALVVRLGAIRVRSDMERKRLAGFHALADTGSGVATGLYSSEFNRRTFQKIAELTADILAAGFPVVVDATFLKRSDRDPFRALAETHGVPLLILDFPTDERICRERIRRRMRERSDASEATEAVLDHQLRSRESLREDELKFVLSVDTEQPATIDAAVAEIERRCRSFARAARGY